MCCRRSCKRGDWGFLFLLKFHHHRFWARTVPGRAHPLEVLMSQQLFSRYPADVVEHGKLGAHLALLMPPLAALLYPFLLAAFHANIAPVISGQSAEPALQSAAATLFLLLAFAAPIVALLGAMTLGELAAPSVTQQRARTIALLAVAAAPLFVFLGVEFYMLRDPVPDTWVWVAFWLGMTTLAGFWRNETRAPPPANAAPAPLRVAHGISAVGIIAIFLAMHLANHLTFILGPDTYRAVMRAMRHVYRKEFVQPVLVALLLFQVGSGVSLATHSDVRPMDRFRTFQIASGIFLAAYVLGHMNSVFVFARLYLGIDSDWAFATGAPSGLIKDAWNIRLVPHYGLAVFFVLSHLAAGGRSVLLAHGVARRFADRFLIASATAAGLVAFVIMFGMCGARLSFVIP